MISGKTYLCDECDLVWELAHLQKSRACILAALYLRPRPPFFSLRKSPSVAFRLLLRFPRRCLVLIALNLSVNLLLDIIERGAYSAALHWLDCVVLCWLISSLPLASSCPPFPNLAASLPLAAIYVAFHIPILLCEYAKASFSKPSHAMVLSLLR